MKSKILMMVLGAALAGVAETVWPGDGVKLVPSTAASVAARDGVAVVHVGTCPANVWPALYFAYPSPRDLSQAGSVRVTFTNLTDATLRLSVKIKGETLQGRLPEGGCSVPPHASRTKDLPLFAEKWAFDRDPCLVGLKRRPYVGGGSSYSLERVKEISVYLPAGSSDVSFGVTKVEVMPGTGGGERPTILKADTFFPWVDAFGQSNFCDWPDKIHGAEELRARDAAEAAALAAHPCGIPDSDRFGGWAAGPQRAATGFFRVEKIDGKWWLVDPDGHLFISHGVNMGWNYTSTAVTYREHWFERLPPRTGETKAFWRHVTQIAQRNFYGDPAHVPYDAFSFSTYNLFLKYGADWRAKDIDRVVRRQRAWGINTTTGTDAGLLKHPQRVPYVTAIGPRSRPIEGANGYWGKLGDPFAPEFAESCRKQAEANRAKGTDPWCLGWTSNNEQSWGADGAALARGVLASPPDQPARIACVQLLAAKGKTPETATKEDLRALGEAVAEKYYSTVRAAIKAVAPNHLYLGDRNDKQNPDVFRAASRHCDAITVNIYDHHPDRALPAGSEDRPFLVTEFHFGCYDTGYFYASLIPVKDQATRAQCYLGYMRAVADNPNYVGAHWFQWRDCPVTGVVGESANAQCGFVSMADVPYSALTDAVRTFSAEMYARRFFGVSGI